MRATSLMVVSLLLGCAPSQPSSTVPSGIQVVSGEAQVRLAGHALDDEIVLRVVNEVGDPLSGVTVELAVDVPGAMAQPSPAESDEQGLVTVKWRLGVTPGEQTLRVSFPNRPTQQPFEVTAMAEAAQALAVDGVDRDLCAIYVDGRLGCWALRLPTDEPPVPLIAVTELRFTELALANRDHDPYLNICGPTTSGRVWCVDFDRTEREFLNWRAVEGGYASLHDIGGSPISSGERNQQYCGLDPDGVAWCWGGNAEGKLGDGTLASRDDARPVLGDGRFVSISVGTGHVCALEADGTAWCWGIGWAGQLGRPPVDFGLVPQPIESALRFTSIRALSDYATCATRQGGQLWCWGFARALGRGMPHPDGGHNHPTPGLVTGMDPIATFGRFDFATYAFTASGSGYWWGELGLLHAFADTPLATLATMPFTELVGTARSRFVCGRSSATGNLLAMAASPGVSCVSAYLLAGRGTDPVGDDFHDAVGSGVPLP
jgi:hypothetical protein